MTTGQVFFRKTQCNQRNQVVTPNNISNPQLDSSFLKDAVKGQQETLYLPI
jgi:hypothetical protein